MESWLLLGYLVASAVAITEAILIGVQTWEHHRFARSRLSQVRHAAPFGRAVVIVPCKGFDLGLEKNLRSLFRQDYEDYELRLVVESVDDPAYQVIRCLMARYPRVQSRLIVAGKAEWSGQKVHNLRVATADLPRETRFLAFADSDARLRRPWLRVLISRLDEENVGAATGYRWFIPMGRSRANHILYSLNTNLAVFLGSHSPTVVWGGSWAIRREVFDRLRLRETWKGTLSDDLVASRALQQAGLRVLFEPACMVASPTDTSLRDFAAFARRQYLMCRFYLPFWWAVIVLAITLSSVVFWGSFAMAAWLLATGNPWSWLPALITAVLYGLNVPSGCFRKELALTYFPRLRNKLRPSRRFEVWSGPIVALVHCLALVASMFGRRISWRGITYRLSRQGQVMGVQRYEAPHEEPQNNLPSFASIREEMVFSSGR